MIANRARIHRFGNLAGLYLVGVDSAENPANTEMAYLSADLAEKLADDLNRYAADIRANKPTASQLGTANVTETGE